jgi:hypothetical protein
LSIPVAVPKAIAYHEAFYSDALDLHPLGHLQRNHNKDAFDPPPPTPGPNYLVEATRWRGTGPTTAVDVVMPEGSTVVSPIDGTVVLVKRYKLYGKYPDMQVEIRSATHPDLRVVIIHLDEVTVRRGDEVSARLSPIGKPRVFPFHSEVNDYVPGGDPHVHIEVKNDSKNA